MSGILRVIPCENSRKSHRTMIFRHVPSESLIEDIVGDKIEIVKGFDSILHGGAPRRCLAFCGRHHWDLRDNVFAGLIYFQALIRKTGFVEVERQTTLTGPVAVLYGEEGFIKRFLEGILFGHLPLQS